jgi:hypothetical protein
MLRKTRRAAVVVVGVLALASAAWLWAAYRTSDDRLPPGAYALRNEPHWTVPPARATAIRDDALASARVWREPPVPIERADLTVNAGDRDPIDTTRTLACKFLPRATSGTTPKFDCVLPSGQVVKVKYGGTAENYAEVAAARLLAALGFGADRMYVVPRVRCFGCPVSPFRAYQALEMARMDEAYTRQIDYDHYRDFEWAAVEVRFQAASIDTPEIKGWGFFELDRIDPARGGSRRAHVDALRLMAVFLHHWDNKAENQRLVCLREPKPADNGECPRPFALVQDLGSTFGPNKVNFESWSTRPVWSDAATCAVDMKDMPFAGATFGSATIGEDGRRFLAERLRKLSPAQIRALFVAARFPEYHERDAPGADVENWMRAFQQKVREIADREPCPPSAPAVTSGAGSSPSPR